MRWLWWKSEIEEEDEELQEPVSCYTIWWDTREKLKVIPRTLAAPFIKPDHDDIRTTADLIYQYGQALKHLPSLLRRLPFKTRTLEDELHEAKLRGNLRKAFHGFDLLMIGLGIVIGSGAFSLTGEAQAVYAGSAVLVSYAIAGLACICAAACYAELCMEYPISGSAFTYTIVTFGEFPAYVTMGMLLCQYVLGMAAIARGFSKFLAQLVNQSATLFVFDDGGIQLDVMACAVVLVLSVALSFGVRESQAFLTTSNLLKLTFILFISIAGYANANGAYFTDNFTIEDKGAGGVFQATAFIFFAYVAFDAVCNAVEETIRPTRIPGAILGTVTVSTVFYMMLSSSLSLISTPEELTQCASDRGDIYVPQPEDCLFPNETAYNLAFTVAFNGVGLPWMQYIVAIAALLGITTSLMVGLYSVARLAMVAARTWLLPAPLAIISRRTQTPLIAQMSIGLVVSVIALLVKFTVLSELVSLSALFSMWMVSNVVLFRRYYPEVKLRYTAHGTVEAEYSKALWWSPTAALPRTARRVVVAAHLLLINAISIGSVIFYRLRLNDCDPNDTENYDECKETVGNMATNGLLELGYWLIAWAVVTLSMAGLCPMEYVPKSWAIKGWLMPFMPSFAILLIAASVGSFLNRTFILFVSYLAILTLLYVFLSMPMSYIRHFTVGPTITEKLRVIQLVEHKGMYVDREELLAKKSAAARREMSGSYPGSYPRFGSSGGASGTGSGSGGRSSSTPSPLGSSRFGPAASPRMGPLGVPAVPPPLPRRASNHPNRSVGLPSLPALREGQEGAEAEAMAAVAPLPLPVVPPPPPSASESTEQSPWATAPGAPPAPGYPLPSPFS